MRGVSTRAHTLIIAASNARVLDARVGRIVASPFATAAADGTSRCCCCASSAARVRVDVVVNAHNDVRAQHATTTDDVTSNIVPRFICVSQRATRHAARASDADAHTCVDVLTCCSRVVCLRMHVRVHAHTRTGIDGGVARFERVPGARGDVRSAELLNAPSNVRESGLCVCTC
jgi:hypothetical protein